MRARSHQIRTLKCPTWWATRGRSNWSHHRRTSPRTTSTSRRRSARITCARSAQSGSARLTMSNGNGGGGGFDFGGIFDPLIGVLAAIIDAIIAFLNALVVALVQVL